MRKYLDVKCPRCGWTESFRDIVADIALTGGHVCVDGVRPDVFMLVSERTVPGPGERLREDRDERPR